MKAFASTSLVLTLLICTYQAFAAAPAAAPLKAQANPYWWLLVIPGFIILWIVRTRKK